MRLALFLSMRYGGRLIMVLAVGGPVCVASVNPHGARLSAQWDREHAVRRASYHQAAVGAHASCESLRPAEALATPDPLLDAVEVKGKVAVSFVIGTDGRVHSPVVLESAGSDEDSNVLGVMRAWRYRPATCNAVPADTESKVEFSSR